MSEGNPKDLPDKKGVLPYAFPFPANHQLPDQSSVVTSLLPMELDWDGVALNLEEGHVEGALSRDEDVVGVNVILDIGHFESKWDLFG